MDGKQLVQSGTATLIFSFAFTAFGFASPADKSVSTWNTIAVQATITAGQAGGPQARALAMTQIAIHDALNAIDSQYERYAFRGHAESGASVEAAIATAARDALIGAIGVGEVNFIGFGTLARQASAIAQIEAEYSAALLVIPSGPPKSEGIAIGQASASAILKSRSTDRATTAFKDYTPGSAPGEWQPTPNPAPSNPGGAVDLQPALLPWWGLVRPFVLRRSNQFEPDGPPRLGGRRYARDYNEVKAVGEQKSMVRTPEQSSIAQFWYEGSQIKWNRIARAVAKSRSLDSWATARLLALVNIAIADGVIAGFQAKYDFNFWRPVTAIRAGDTDRNYATDGDPMWSSFLNTPMIPDYPSTHSVFGGAASEVLRRFFHDDNVPFTVESGVAPFITTTGAPFAAFERSFSSFSEAAIENGESRIYAGIHFRSAVQDGIKQGRSIGRFVFTHSLASLDPDADEDW
jgi:hypothetical protein